MKAHKVDGSLEVGHHKAISIAQREGLLFFATVVFYILYGKVVEWRQSNHGSLWWRHSLCGIPTSPHVSKCSPTTLWCSILRVVYTCTYLTVSNQNCSKSDGNIMPCCIMLRKWCMAARSHIRHACELSSTDPSRYQQFWLYRGHC